MNILNKDNPRYRVHWLDEQAILRVFQRSMKDESFFNLPILPNLPSDYEVVRVHYDFMRRAFGLTIWSSEYDLCPPGMLIPCTEGILETREICYQVIAKKV